MDSPDVFPPLTTYDLDVETLIIGAGAAGMIAALSAHEAGQDVLLIEADQIARGSTALSAGLIPAAGTSVQRAAGIQDTSEAFARDIQDKAGFENDQALVDACATVSAEVIEWLIATHDMPFSLVTDFDYPGHSRRRMHGLPTRSGAELIDRLRNRIEELGIALVCDRRATSLFARNARVFGAELSLPDGSRETVQAQRIILACNGFGGNRDMVHKHMPDIKDALWFGHDGNRGEAVTWARALGAATRHLGAYQGHGNVAHPHGILITWATMTEGGVQVNLDGERFWNEAQGYSEAARAVLAQPQGQAWAIFDGRIAAVARQFADFKAAEAAGAVICAPSLGALEEACKIPQGALERTLNQVPRTGPDVFGRNWAALPLTPPFCAVKVTGALFHTQGGLEVDPENALVRRVQGGNFENLYAVGGAACGVSGTGDSGYLSGNGLLCAFALGRLAGQQP